MASAFWKIFRPCTLECAVRPCARSPTSARCTALRSHLWCSSKEKMSTLISEDRISIYIYIGYHIHYRSVGIYIISF